MIAKKLRIIDVISAKVEEGKLMTISGEAYEVRLLGTIVDSFLSSDGNYASLTLDDGTETVRIKQWGSNVSSLTGFKRGEMVEVVGKPLIYNEEIYITPELIVLISPNRWVAHELEMIERSLKNAISERKEEPTKVEEAHEAETFDIFEEDDYVEKVFEVLKDRMLTKKEIIATSRLDDIDVELALRQLLDDGRIELSGGKYKRAL
jgi:RPA family protein